ncbi:PaaI family thioesterase [Pantoea sp. 18069]|uniref:PaaI family thioesterase n=1 Tax=Pantoea sp. 18069 TaxID=2681415 RepID=UPI001356CA35|nr:PaaI family thioesterase [Pantoea sp. 18069]
MTSETSCSPSDQAAVALDSTAGIPPGFVPYTSASPYVAHLGPLYQREDENGMRVIGMRIGAAHLNLHGKAHGGMLAVLIDSALGYNVARAREQPVVTAHLSVDYLEAVAPGDWLQAHVRLTKSGGRLCFAECVLLVEGREMVRASGILPVVKTAS